MEEKEQEKDHQININNNLPGRTKNSIINNISKAAAAVVYANSKKNTSINSSSKFSGSDSEHTSQQSHGVFDRITIPQRIQHAAGSKTLILVFLTLKQVHFLSILSTIRLLQ